MNKNNDLTKGTVKPKSKGKYSLQLALEPRFLFDATIAGAQQLVEQLTTPAQSTAPPTDATSVSADALNSDKNVPTTHIETPALSDFDAFQKANASKDGKSQAEQALDADKAANLAEGGGDESKGPEILFIDSSIKDYKQIMDAAASNSNMHVVLLDAQKDGIEQMTKTLSNFHDISAVHIMSSDAEGIAFGKDVLSEQNLSVFGDSIALWNNHLASNADILIYDNDVVQNADSINLIKDFSSLSGADVGLLHLNRTVDTHFS